MKTLSAAVVALASVTLAAGPVYAESHHAHKAGHTHKVAKADQGSASTDDLNSKSLAAAQSGQAAPGAPAAPTTTAPLATTPGVTAPVPAEGTGVTVPAAPATPTMPSATEPTNAPTSGQ
jgi:hypothetical protein